MDLSTEYMGLKLVSPIVPSASPLSKDLAAIREMEEAGAGAVVLFSLFEEQLSHEAAELDHYLHYGAERFAESLTYFPQVREYRLGPDDYLDHIRQAKRTVSIPIIASLNGLSPEGWIDYAVEIQRAGADALEINAYQVPTDPNLSSLDIEDRLIAIFRTVRPRLSIPIAMKLSPFFSSLANLTQRLDKEGVSGLVLFNRFLQPDLDMDSLEAVPTPTLSSPGDLRLPLRWMAILHGRLRASLAASSGIHNGLDVAKVIAAGADVAMTASALLKNGVGYLRKLHEQLRQYLEEKEYASVDELRGILSQQTSPDPTAFERANYIKALNSFGLTATLE